MVCARIKALGYRQLHLSENPMIVYDSRLFVSLHRDDASSISEPYPIGTQVVKPSSSNKGILRSVTLMDIPMDLATSPQYLILFNDSNTESVPESIMASLIPKPEVSTSDPSHLLPLFLRLNYKITYKHKGVSIKDTSPKPPTATTASVISPMSVRNIPAGVPPCQTFPPLGTSYDTVP